MANHKSAAKRARQEERRKTRNMRTKSALRTAEKKLVKLIESKKGKEAQELLVSLTSKISKAAQKGMLHANTASRKISRLAKQVHRIG